MVKDNSWEILKKPSQQLLKELEIISMPQQLSNQSRRYPFNKALLWYLRYLRIISRKAQAKSIKTQLQSEQHVREKLKMPQKIKF